MVNEQKLHLIIILKELDSIYLKEGIEVSHTFSINLSVRILYILITLLKSPVI